MDTALDTTTGDITATRTTSLVNAVYLRLTTPLGSWWADPELGSELHLLQRAKDLSSIRKLAIQYAEAALKPLRDDGRAATIEVSTVDQAGRCVLVIDITRADGEREHFEHPVKVI